MQCGRAASALRRMGRWDTEGRIHTATPEARHQSGCIAPGVLGSSSTLPVGERRGCGTQKICVPKMARPDDPNGKFCCFPTTLPLVCGRGGPGRGAITQRILSSHMHP